MTASRIPLALSALSTLAIVALAPAAPATAGPRLALRATVLAQAMPVIAPVDGPGAELLVPGRRPDTVFRLRATLPQVERRLDYLYSNRVTLPDGRRVLGYTVTSWGEIHALIGRGRAGRVVTFLPAGDRVLARVESVLRDPALGVRARRHTPRRSR